MLGMLRAARVQDAFVDLLCGDEDFVQAEFDALIEACWPDEPPGAAPHPPAAHPHGTARPHSVAWIRAGTDTLAVRRSASERAPP
jgi:hypothetical protein